MGCGCCGCRCCNSGESGENQQALAELIRTKSDEFKSNRNRKSQICIVWSDGHSVDYEDVAVVFRQAIDLRQSYGRAYKVFWSSDCEDETGTLMKVLAECIIAHCADNEVERLDNLAKRNYVMGAWAGPLLGIYRSKILCPSEKWTQIVAYILKTGG